MRQFALGGAWVDLVIDLTQRRLYFVSIHIQKVDFMTDTILSPSAAGRFYSADADELRREVKSYIDSARIDESDAPVAVILTPHAGYPFSGPVAGCSFRHIQNQAIDTVVFIGLAHRGVETASLFDGGGFETPLGVIETDRELAGEILNTGGPVQPDSAPFRGEHSIEVNLPFVQTVLPQAKAVGILISRVDPGLCQSVGEQVARAVKAARGKRVLIAVSSDMSHYPPYNDAMDADTRMLASIETLDSERILLDLERLAEQGGSDHHCVMCGGAAMLAGVAAARALGAERAETLHYQNSGDSSYGDRDRVVGYGSLAIYLPDTDEQDDSELDDEARKELLHIARESIKARFARQPYEPQCGRPALQARRGMFVTLKNRGELRGCLGRFDPGEAPLYQLAAIMAGESANADRRFSPLGADELDTTDVEISVLSPRRKVESIDEIQIGRDGLYITGHSTDGRLQSGTLLPQVASDRNWTREEFLESTCVKAGLDKDAWRDDDTLIEAYKADVFGDLDYQSPPFA